MKRLLRKLLPLFLLAIAGGIYYAYTNQGAVQKQKEEAVQLPQTEIVFTATDQAASILGATAERIKTTTRTVIDKLSNEQEEALINSTVENISRQVKDLPQEQVTKIKYEFCKDVLSENENNE